MSASEFNPGAEAANRAIEIGITAGLNYAAGFLAGVSAVFLEHGRFDQAEAFKAAAGELGRVEPAHVREELERGD